MAFDDTTRARLREFASDARTLLTAECTRQLQHEYGMDPETGEVVEPSKLPPLDDTRWETARMLRETLAHYLATSPAGGRTEALQRIVREQAFTVLNRLVALRMMEARGFLLESLARGYQSRGFQLYQRLAGSSLGETGDAYRYYLMSLFDEFALDLAVLFDRFSPQGRLFPHEAALLELLGRINHPEIEPLWAEDETIGWIYQYYNSQEERRQMRADSPAPRNSRELAVRNQFFTPRYVVEFLTDNTLGRLWYEMTQGQTVLTDQCCYMVRRPNEIFLQPGEEAPTQAEPHEDLSQEDLLKQPVYIPFRALKDPRDIIMLDPACGSMHFGLYAFDLYEKIYDEAWELEGQRGTARFTRSPELKPLHDTYATKEEFLCDVPRLIIEHNIHGIDIDPRAVQVAGLSLWLRAQRSWQAQGIKPQQRPQIQRTHVVCAESMPGEKEMLKEFTTNLQPRVLGQLVEHIFDKMQLAGEAGSLLRIEEEIIEVVEQAREEFNHELIHRREVEGYLLPEVAPKREPTLFDFADLPDRTRFWDRAEREILEALKIYAEQAEGTQATQKRLFAQDAAKGFAFIDLCRKRYDVLVMNPPFGEAIGGSAPSLKRYLIKNLYSCFVERAIEVTKKSGCFGAITDSTYLKQPTFFSMRNLLLRGEKRISYIVDLGWNVLDANVRTALVVCHANQGSSFCSLDLADRELRNELLRSAIESNSFVYRSYEEVIKLPKSVLAINLPVGAGTHLTKLPQLKNFAELPWGCGANDSTRLFRLRWEIYPSQIGEMWAFLTNGGLYSPFYRENYFVCRIRVENGDSAFTTKFKNDSDTLYDASAQHLYFTPGLTYPKRSRFFHVSVLPGDHIFTPEGKGLFLDNIEKKYLFLGMLNSSVIMQISDFLCGPHKQRGDVELIGIPELSATEAAEVEKRAHEVTCRMQLLARACEDSSLFVTPCIVDEPLSNTPTLREFLRTRELTVRQLAEASTLCFEAIDSIAEQNAPWLTLDNDCVAELHQARSGIWAPYLLKIEDVVSYLFGLVLGRWDIRYAIEQRPFPQLPDPFAPLPVCPPGMLLQANGLPAEPEDVSDNYPLRISWPGILVDNEGHLEDIISRVREAIDIIWKELSSNIEHEICTILSVKLLRDYFVSPNNFFATHLKRYSKSRRQAPIYWPLQIPSGSYTLWLYYHRLNDQTLYTCVNDFVEPKLKQVTEQLDALRTKTNRSKQEEKDLERLLDFEQELKDFRDELLRVAKFWKPNLNDGVQITAAPLWKLFQHKPWQKTLKDTWEKLEKGDYDWAHLAYSICPDRVREKCRHDKSLAIAHGLEELYQAPPAQPKKKRGRAGA